MNAQRKLEVQVYGFLNLGSRWGADGQRHTRAILPLGKSPNVHSTGGSVGSTAHLEECVKSRPHQCSNAEPFNS
jgi:hypothetical protein